jgi:hypothetical protein
MPMKDTPPFKDNIANYSKRLEKPDQEINPLVTTARRTIAAI